MGFFKKLKDKFFSSENTSIKKATIAKEDKMNFVEKTDEVFDTVKTSKKYVAGLDKTSSNITKRINKIFSNNKVINSELFEKLEEELILADLGYKMTSIIVEEVKKEVETQNITNSSSIKEIIADKIFVIYSNMSFVETTIEIGVNKPKVILMSGVNGAGKTTTIGKLSNKFKKDGHKVLIAAADTFRAAAEEQMEEWAKKVGVDCVRGQKEGQDPASVVYDALNKAISEKYDILIIDTAGRLQNKINLMKQLEKINKVLLNKIAKEDIENLIVLDAINGQNSLSQAKEFDEILELDGIILTKMDGTAKGGIILNIKEQLKLPVKFIGLGEGVDDLQEFDLEKYIYGLFKEWVDGN